MWAYGGTCGPMGVQVGLWGYMWAYGSTCGPMGVHVGLWGYMWAYGGTCRLMGAHVGLWGHMWAYGTCKPTCGPMGVHWESTVSMQLGVMSAQRYVASMISSCKLDDL